MKLIAFCVLGLALLLFAVVLEAATFDPPTRYRGIPWGTPMQIVRQRLKERYGEFTGMVVRKGVGEYACDLSTPTTAKCMEDFPFWDAKMLWSPELSGADPTLEGVKISANTVGGANNYPQVRAAFLARYGKTDRITSETYRNKLGQAVQGEILIWETEDILIQLQEHCDWIGKSCGEILTKRYLRLWKELETERARQRGRALP